MTHVIQPWEILPVKLKLRKSDEIGIELLMKRDAPRHSRRREWRWRDERVWPVRVLGVQGQE